VHHRQTLIFSKRKIYSRISSVSPVGTYTSGGKRERESHNKQLKRRAREGKSDFFIAREKTIVKRVML
jgi:hypothetical protein